MDELHRICTSREAKHANFLVVHYIASALDTFDRLGPEKRQEIAFEIALLLQRGLDINDAEQKYALRTLPGKYSGLHLLALIYTGFKQIDPMLHSGADFDAKYKMAIEARDKKHPSKN